MITADSRFTATVPSRRADARRDGFRRRWHPNMRAGHFVVLTICAAMNGCHHLPTVRTEDLPDWVRERAIDQALTHAIVEDIAGRGDVTIQIDDTTEPPTPRVLYLATEVRDCEAMWVPLHHGSHGLEIDVALWGIGRTEPVKIRCLLDTGADATVSLTKASARKAGAVILADWPCIDMYDAAGGWQSNAVSLLEQMGLGGEQGPTLAPVRVNIRPSGGLSSGLLGIHALERFAHILIDWNKPQIWLAPNRIDEAPMLVQMRQAAGPGRWEWIQWRRRSHERQVINAWRCVTIDIDGVMYEAQIDTGSSVPLSDPFGLLDFARPKLGVMRAVSGLAWKESGRVPEVRLGPLCWTDVEVSRPRRVRTSAYPYLIIGRPLLESHPMLLDFAGDRIGFWLEEPRFHPSAAPSARLAPSCTENRAIDADFTRRQGIIDAPPALISTSDRPAPSAPP